MLVGVSAADASDIEVKLFARIASFDGGMLQTGRQLSAGSLIGVNPG
jgi:hypothetical protein